MRWLAVVAGACIGAAIGIALGAGLPWFFFSSVGDMGPVAGGMLAIILGPLGGIVGTILGGLGGALIATWLRSIQLEEENRRLRHGRRESDGDEA
jgi:hypothetical protein